MTAQKRKRVGGEKLTFTLMAIPFAVFTFMFSYVPLIGWLFAFTNYKPGRSLANLRFEGLKYFRYIITFWGDVSNALRNTLALSAMSLATMALPMIFALMLNEIRSGKYKRLAQTVVTMPHFVSWIIVYSLCFALFSTDGMLNALLHGLGVQGNINILGNADTTWLFMTILGVWKSIGWSSIVYLAAIAGVDETLYDAAMVDGAGRLRCAIHITLPGVLPTFIVLLVLNIGNFLNLGLEKYLLFSNTVTSPKLEVIDMLTYRMGIGTQQYSFATAIGIMKSGVSIVLLSFANLLAKRIRGEGVL